MARAGHPGRLRRLRLAAGLPVTAGGRPGGARGDQAGLVGEDDELRAGASGFLLKDTQPAELLQGMRIVMRGDSLLSPAVTRRLIGEFVARPPDAVAAAGMETLTSREREVVALVAHGLSNDEIADVMVVSPTTAKTHVSRAMIKLGARDRAQLVVFAYQTGLVTPRAAGTLP